MPTATIDILRDHALRIHAGVAAVLNTDAELAEDAVHHLRVASKEVRALWLLLQPLLDDHRAKQAIADLGRAAASLSEARDRYTTSEALTRLCQQSRGEDTRKALRQALQLLQTTGPDKSTRTVASQQLRDSWAEDYKRWQTLESNISGAELISSGYGRLYRKAYRLSHEILHSDDLRLWHTLRKRVKYLALTLPLVGEGRKLKTLCADFTRLAAKLGRLHDLGRLQIELAALEWPEHDSAQAAAASRLVHRKTVKVRKDCAALTQAVFATKPRKFIRELERQNR